MVAGGVRSQAGSTSGLGVLPAVGDDRLSVPRAII